MKRDARYIVSLVLAGVFLVVTPGCTESLLPREPYDDPFAVYGLLTPDRDTQFVWVFPIEEFPTLGAPEALEDVTVTSTDLETSEVRIWQDTVVVRDNGQHEYLYRAPFRAAFDRRYRVEVRRAADDEASWAEVRIPPLATVKVLDASRDTVMVDILGESVQVMRTEVEYRVRIAAQPDTSYMRQYWGSQQKIDGGWRVKIRFNIDRFWVEAWYVVDFQTGYGLCPTRASLRLGEMRLHVLVGDTTWNPHGPAFDSYILSQPGTMQNVQNGTGFIGGGYRLNALLDVPQEAVEAACFIYCWSPWVCDVN